MNTAKQIKEYHDKYSKKYRQEHKEKYKEYNKIYYQEHKEQWKEYAKNRPLATPEQAKHRLEYIKKWNQVNKEYLKEYRKQWGKIHKEHRKKYMKIYRKKNKEVLQLYRNRYKNQQYNSNPQFRLNSCMRTGINQSLKGNKNGKHWETLVNYTLEDLMIHLEFQFQEGMTWENYGKWHVDHIIPISFFKFQTYDDQEFKECWALDNLQPLWAKDNIRKHNNIV